MIVRGRGVIHSVMESLILILMVLAEAIAHILESQTMGSST